MGIWYYARLLWGIKTDKPVAKRGVFSDEQDQIDEKFDDIETWFEKKTDNLIKGIKASHISYCYDGSGPDETGYYIYPEELSFETEMYSFMEVKIPQFNEYEMKIKLKTACEILDVEYSEPKWYLMTHGC